MILESEWFAPGKLELRMSKSDLFNTGVALVLIAISYAVGGTGLALVCFFVGIVIIVVARLKKEEGKTSDEIWNKVDELNSEIRGAALDNNAQNDLDCDVVIKHVTSDAIGETESTPDAWFFILTNLTLINRSRSSDTITFALQMPVESGGGFVTISPLAAAPDFLPLTFQEKRLLTCVQLPSGVPVDGSILFRLPRGQVMKGRLRRPEGDISEAMAKRIAEYDQPAVSIAKLIVTSEFSGKRRIFDALSLRDLTTT